MNLHRQKTRLILATAIVLILSCIVLSCFIGGIDKNQKAEAAALDSTNADILSELLVSGYATRTDGVVFNGDVLSSLYKKVAGSTSATYSTIVTESKKTTGKGTAITMHSGRDATQIRDGNSNKFVVVTINGLKWTVISLSTNTSNEPILTLMLTDTNQSELGRWSNWSETETTRVSGNYPVQMYSTSYLRAQLLNGKNASGGNVQYSIDNSHLIDYTRPDKIYNTSIGSYKFDIFAHNSAKGSLTKFLVAPKDVAYQQSENYHAAHQGVWGNAQSFNESSKNKIGINNGHVESLANYFDWASDYIWLPAVTEIGWGQNKDCAFYGIWNVTSPTAHDIMGTSTSYWTRMSDGDMLNGVVTGISATFTEADSLYAATVWSTVADQTCYIRPCIHLNLKAANDAALTSLTNAANVTTTYSGEQQDYFKKDGSNVSWYNATLYSSSNANVKVEYFDKDNNDKPLDAGTKPLECGTYSVKLTIQNSKYKWASGGQEKTITYTINQKSLTVSCDWNASPPKATPTNLCSRDTGIKDDILRIRYNTVGLTDYTYDYPTKVGKDYVAVVEIDTEKSKNYQLASTYSTTFTLNTSGIAVPEVVKDDSDWLSYNGQEQAYHINYKKDKVKIEIADEYKGKNLFDLDEDYILVTNAGVYENAIKATLLDPYNPADNSGSDVWAGTSADTAPRYISFTLKALNLTVTSTSSLIDAQMGDTPTLTIMTPNKPNSGHTLTVDIMGQLDENSTPRSIGQFTFSSTSSNAQNITLDLSGLRVTGNYALSFVVDNKNYSLTFSSPVTLHLTHKTETPTLTWWLQENGVMTGDTVDAEIGKDTSVDFDVTDLIYNGKEYSFMVTANNGYSVYIDYNTGEFSAGYKNDKATNAGDYTTQVAIKKNGEETKFYSINWTIGKAKFDLSKVKWIGDGEIEYTGSEVQMTLENLPDGLEAYAHYDNNKDTSVGDKGKAVVSFVLTGDALRNYYAPEEGGKGVNYIYDGSGDFAWDVDWKVTPAKLSIGARGDWESATYTGDDYTFDYYKLKDSKADGVVDYEYYETDNTGKILEGAEAIDSLDDIEYSATVRKYYKALPKLSDTDNYEFSNPTADLYSPFFTVGGGASEVSVSIATDKIEYNGKPRNVKLVIEGSGATVNDFDLTYYSGDMTDDAHKLEGAPTDKGNYTVVITSKKSNVVISGKNQYTFEIISATINKSWNKDAKPYVLNLKYGQIDGIEYVIADDEGNIVEYSALTAGNTYQIKAKIKDNMQGNYSFSDGTYETDWEVFELRAEDIANMQDPNDPNNIHYPKGDENEDPDNPPSGAPSGDASGEAPSGDTNGGGTLDELLNKLRELPLWQLIASVISIMLIIIFLSKTAGYASKSKKLAKKTEKMENASTVFAGAFLGLATTGWTAIACVLMGLAVLSLVIMIIAKNKYNKVEEEYEEKKEEYDRNKSEMMYMRMMGGNMGGMGQGMQQGGYGYQQGLGVEDIRGIVSETMTALLPGVQQLLPQQASTNDELVEKLIDQNERLMHQLAQQSTHETVVAREVAATSSVGEDTIKRLIDKNDERIEKLMEKILELSANQNVQPQIIEKEVPVEVEKIVEKVVEVPVEVEKIVEVEKEVKVEVEVPVEVEKIVEKEVIKEVPVEVEKIVEVEKEVIKEVKVEVPVAAPPKPKKEVAPKLTLDEAYALLSKEQKKYFDGLKAYALSKDKCKEKKSTYFTVFGATTTNPILKLTIKKDTTVALLKMEDEFMKDLRRDASGDGTKVKVKETEIVVSDAQAFDTAKKMVDLREDQIERYQDLLKEQRASRK